MNQEVPVVFGFDVTLMKVAEPESIKSLVRNETDLPKLVTRELFVGIPSSRKLETYTGSPCFESHFGQALRRWP